MGTIYNVDTKITDTEDVEHTLSVWYEGVNAAVGHIHDMLESDFAVDSITIKPNADLPKVTSA